MTIKTYLCNVFEGDTELECMSPVAIDKSVLVGMHSPVTMKQKTIAVILDLH